VPTWATLESDLERLRRLPNVHVLKPAEDIDEILAQTRILLVPSLWGEGFGLIVVEAMLRGIPVLASNVGGLPEAKMGVDYLLPVRRIDEYRDQADERGLPIPIIPPQNIDPWLEALDRLIADPPYYRQLSNTSRATAMAAISALDITPFEAFLEAVSAGRDDIGRSRQRSTTMSADGAATVSAAAALSRDRLELLVTLLRRDRA
jgi:glycosyltransferase involved in cell wall biosynthesis